MIHICGYIPESINDGNGLRAVVFFSGCKHKCLGCHNESSWDFAAGEPFTEDAQDQIIEDICSNPLLDGLTLSGGDPFFSPNEVSDFIDRFRKRSSLSIWIYSGFIFEAIKRDPQKKNLLVKCDVLVDGKFYLSQRDSSLLFRGSKNQRIIDIQKSMAEGAAVSYEN
ncbi:Pyruvate formate-lyase 1-activating enzyme [compost metagenome]